MSGDRDDRPTIVRGERNGGIRPAESAGGRDDKTRVRLPAVGHDAGQGGAGDPGAAQRVEQRRPRRAAGRTVQMQTVPTHFGWLIMKTGTRVGHVYRLGLDVTDLGRDADNDIVVDDDRVSEEHTRIRVDEEGRFVVWDLASTNGTYVNGERITAATPITENDEVMLGQTVLVLKTLDLET